MPDLIVIYGPPLAGKTTIAHALGRAMSRPTAVVSTDYLLNEAIARPDPDRHAELELVHQQLRLLVANYLKFHYNCIVEGPFMFESDGRLVSYEAAIDQLLALMRMMTLRKMIVRLSAPEEALASRAAATGRLDDLDLARRVQGSYRQREGPEVLEFNTGAHSAAEVVEAVLQRLPGMPRGQA
ncbi:MAG TPA: AAA family ATPase [Dehalococcoidia bacterium]|nr:AAA family ATPase [Dehalococcoidia bacterium]